MAADKPTPPPTISNVSETGFTLDGVFKPSSSTPPREMKIDGYDVEVDRSIYQHKCVRLAVYRHRVAMEDVFADLDMTADETRQLIAALEEKLKT